MWLLGQGIFEQRNLRWIMKWQERVAQAVLYQAVMGLE